MPEISEETLRAFDPNLPLLASQAAIELDNLIRQRATDLNATKRLAQLLSNSLEKPLGGECVTFNADPATVTLVSKTFNSYARAGAIHTVDDLAQEAWRIAHDLTKPQDPASTPSLDSLRAFCAALAECAAAYLHGLHASRSTHPYRR